MCSSSTKGKISRVHVIRTSIAAALTRAARATGLAAIICLVVPQAAAFAQSITITSVRANAPDIGRIVSAPKRPTVFRIAPTGEVLLQSGSGVRLGGGNASPALVTIRCGGGSNATCPSTTVTIQVAGTPTGRAQSLTNFTVAGGSNPPPMSAPKGKNSISFTIDGALKSTTYDFYVGMDFPIAGDDSFAPTGPAMSSFSVSVPASSSTGAAVANVFRPIALTSESSLEFGMIVRPRSGSATVSLDPSSGIRTVTGGAIALSVPAPHPAGFSVSGEGGQTFSISAPAFDMIYQKNHLTVTPAVSPVGSSTLTGALGSNGTATIYVGGSVPISDTTPPGQYSGTMTVTVQYN